MKNTLQNRLWVYSFRPVTIYSMVVLIVSILQRFFDVFKCDFMYGFITYGFMVCVSTIFMMLNNALYVKYKGAIDYNTDLVIIHTALIISIELTGIVEGRYDYLCIGALCSYMLYAVIRLFNKLVVSTKQDIQTIEDEQTDEWLTVTGEDDSESGGYYW